MIRIVKKQRVPTVFGQIRSRLINKLSGADDKTAYSGFLVYLLKQKV